jgi:hypothetical protein
MGVFFKKVSERWILSEKRCNPNPKRTLLNQGKSEFGRYAQMFRLCFQKMSSRIVQKIQSK